MKQRQRRAISATGFGALATALAGAPLPARADGSANHPAPNWGFTTSSANDVGCIKTTVEDPQNKAMHGFLFSRPQGIDIESLSDEELRSCGLQDRRRIRNLSKESPKYQAWLAEAHARLTATQILPWGEAPLRKGYVPPPPPILAPGQPGMLPLGPPPPMVIGPRSIHDNVDHSDLGRSSVLPGINVSPDGYTPFLQPTFSWREILDDVYEDNGQAAAPQIVATEKPSNRFVLPSPSQAVVVTQTASWIGYADQEDSGTGGNSLAQIGVIDQVYNTVGGGAYY